VSKLSSELFINTVYKPLSEQETLWEGDVIGPVLSIADSIAICGPCDPRLGGAVMA
jgi:hypothetical protein